MRVVVGRVKKAHVTVNSIIVGQIGQGFLLLVGFTQGDTVQQIEKLVKKIVHMRVFPDENYRMNLSLLDIKGSILSISQFTLYANTNNGRRPSFENQLRYEEAKDLYQMFNAKLREYGIVVEEGVFGEHMEIESIHDGPVTIILEE